MSRITRLSTLAVITTAMLALSSSASAAIVTVGSPLTAAFAPRGLGLQGTAVNNELGEKGAKVTSPISGTIISWHLLDSFGGAFKLRVLLPVEASATLYKGSGTSAPETPSGLGLQTFSASLPIRAGETIGLDYPASTATVGAAGPMPGARYFTWAPPILEGTERTATEINEGGELAFNAQVQPPPTIATSSPATGSFLGGTSVTITGTDLIGASGVSFGGTPASTFTVNSESQVTAVTPPLDAFAKVSIAVTTAAGAATSASTFEPTACLVPRLVGRKLKVAKKRSRKADCRVGKVTKVNGVRAKTAKVVKQRPKPGRKLAPGAEIKVTLGARPRRRGNAPRI